MPDVFNACLETLEQRHQEGRPADDWMLPVLAPEERLLKFDAWVRQQLWQRLQWPETGRQKAKEIEQCRVRIERLVVDLWRRGWLLDGRRLANHIIAALTDIAEAQKAGRVRKFWPFFCQVMTKYVGVNAEEIQVEARAMAGARPIGSIISQLGLQAKPSQQAPTLPELVAQRREETLREKVARRRKAEAAQAAQKSQLPLF